MLQRGGLMWPCMGSALVAAMAGLRHGLFLARGLFLTQGFELAVFGGGAASMALGLTVSR
jgi:hypothetical protein